jgi:3-oxoadipate enol-lactonase
MTEGVIQTLDGCSVAYRFDGPDHAPVVMLSNSLGTSMAMWDAQVPVWARDYRVLRYDTRGHGRSSVPAGAYSMDRLGLDAVDVMDALGIRRVHFCGLSLGGMIGQWLSIRHPDRLDRLVLANTSAFMGPAANWQARIENVHANGMAPLAAASLSRWFTAPFLSGAPVAVDAVGAMLLQTDPAGYAGCCAAIRDMDMRAMASGNHTRTLVIAGTHDPATSVEEARFLASSAHNARLEELPAAHLSNVECTAAFAELVQGFLAA